MPSEFPETSSSSGAGRAEVTSFSPSWLGGLLNVGDMVGPVSHELHNVMNNIVLQAAIMTREDTEPSRDQINIFRTLAYRASGMLNQLDEYRHSVRFPKQAIDLGGVVRAAVERHAQQGVVIDCQLDSAPAVSGNATDAARLLELLLISAQAAGPPIRVRLGVREGKVVLEIQDSGGEVDQDALDHWFEAFTAARRGENPLERAACRSIARRLEAKLRVSPRPGGATVTVEFRPHS